MVAEGILRERWEEHAGQKGYMTADACASHIKLKDIGVTVKEDVGQPTVQSVVTKFSDSDQVDFSTFLLIVNELIKSYGATETAGATIDATPFEEAGWELPERDELEVEHQVVAEDAAQEVEECLDIAVHMARPTILSEIFLEKPTSPALLYQDKEESYAMPVLKVKMELNVHVSTVFGKLVVVFKNTSKKKRNCLFVVPTKATVSDISVEVGRAGRRRFVKSTYISTDDANDCAHKAKRYGNGKGDQNDLSQLKFLPGVFRLPIRKVNNQEEVRVEVEFTQSLPWLDGRYTFDFPLEFGDGVLPPVDLRKFIDVTITMHPDSLKGVCYGSNTHDILLTDFTNPNEKFKVRCLPMLRDESARQALLEDETKSQPIRAQRGSQIVTSPKVSLHPELGGESVLDDDLASSRNSRMRKSSRRRSSRRSMVTARRSTIRGVLNNQEGERRMSTFGKSRRSSRRSFRGGYQNKDNDELTYANFSGTLHFAYFCENPELSTTLLIEEPGTGWDQEHSAFALYINPPAESAVKFGRDFYFLIDRSGSMAGDPYNSALKGLEFALRTLDSDMDRFNLTCFDNERFSVFDTIGKASAKHKSEAMKFATMNTPRYTTDIESPLLDALKDLNVDHSEDRMRFVVLLTDGAVEEEQDICKRAIEAIGNCRVLTFGVGQWCNYQFLRMLSSTTAGWSVSALYAEDIEPVMVDLMTRAAVPVLTDVTLEGPEMSLYPEKIPDVMLGAAVRVSGKFNEIVKKKQTTDKLLKKKFQIKGRLANGELVTMDVRPQRTNEKCPVGRLAVIQRIEELQARYWMYEEPEIHKEVTEISEQERVPSTFTNMVCYEMSLKEKKQLDRVEDRDSKKERMGRKPKNHDKKGMGKGEIAMLAGGALVLGAGALYAMGNIANSLGNVGPAAGIMGGMAGGMGGMMGGVTDCCTGLVAGLSCGQCEPDACVSFMSCGSCAGCEDMSTVFAFAAPVFAPCGECCNSMDGCIQGVVMSTGACCSGVAQCECGEIGVCFGAVCSQFGDCCGEIGGGCASGGGACGACCGDLLGGAGGGCDAIPIVCGAICGVCDQISGFSGAV